MKAKRRHSTAEVLPIVKAHGTPFNYTTEDCLQILEISLTDAERALMIKAFGAPVAHNFKRSGQLSWLIYDPDILAACTSADAGGTCNED